MSETKTVRRILDYALEREHQGMAFFQQNAGRLHHPTAQGIFEQLAEEERKHIVYIEGLLAQLDSTGELDSKSPLPADTDFFSQRADLEQLDQTVYESMIPDVTILRMAYLIERDFAEFYTQAAEKTSGEVRAALEKLARWETGHELLFKRMHDTLFDQYMEMPWGG